MARSLGLAAVVSFFLACHVVLPLDNSPSQGVDAAALDRGQRADSGDGPAHDGPQAVQDLVPGPDRASSADKAVKPDKLSIAPTAELGVAGYPCIAGAATKAFTYQDKTMVVCEVFTGGVTQCQAASLCTNGWHMCSKTEYINKGGQTETHTITAWIASCVRDGAAPTAPTNAACGGGCAAGTTVYEPHVWDCSGSNEVKSPAPRIGAATFGTCLRIGANNSGTEGMWRGRPTSDWVGGVVCCSGP